MTFEPYRYPENDELGPRWKCVQINPEGRAYYNHTARLRVIVSVTFPTENGAPWLHVSYSHPNKMPTYSTGTLVKKKFIGNEREAISVSTPTSRHVNIMQYCLHLWVPLRPEDKTWPDFETYVPGIGLSI